MTVNLFTIDSETAFKNAIRKVGNKKWVEDFMYVYTKPADGNYLDISSILKLVNIAQLSVKKRLCNLNQSSLN